MNPSCHVQMTFKHGRASAQAEMLLEVEVGGETIHVHSYVLIAASEVFAAMLQSGMQEAQTGRIVLTEKNP